MSTLSDIAPTSGGTLVPATFPLGPDWAYMVGPIGSGKSTILRAIATDAAHAGHPVIALQLQRDNSPGYAAHGAQETFNMTEFKQITETAIRYTSSPGRPALAIVDGAGPDDIESISAWGRQITQAGTFHLICATNWLHAPLFPSWGEPALTIKLDEPEIRGVVTGSILRRSDDTATPWEMILPTPPSERFQHHEELTR